MPSIDSVISRLGEEHKKMEYYSFDETLRNVRTGEAMKLDWDEGKQTYFGTFGGRRLPLGQTCVKTALSFAQIPNAEWLMGKPHQRLVETLYDETRRKGGVQVAVNDREIRAFVPKEFTWLTDHELLVGVRESLRHYGPMGIQVVQDAENESVDYRMLFGKSIGPKGDNVYGMLSIRASEFALTRNEASLGLYREICANGTLTCQNNQTVKWNHRGNKMSFASQMGELLSGAEGFLEQSGHLLTHAMKTKLSASVYYVLYAMERMEILKPRQVELIKESASENNVNTVYDMWNLITDSAKNADLSVRRRIEQSAMNYLECMVLVNAKAEQIVFGGD
jgi:hypothetical protein